MAKKVVSKPKKVSKKIAPEKQAFLTLDGKALKSLFDLYENLDIMTDEVFYHHVTDFRNDFHNWIKDVLKDEKLAQEVLYAGKDRNKCHLVIAKAIIREK